MAHSIRLGSNRKFLTPCPKTAVIMQFAYEHYLASVDAKATEKTTATIQITASRSTAPSSGPLFKSNLATVRYYCLSASLGELENQSPEHLSAQ
jgi:hypothetical protein